MAINDDFLVQVWKQQLDTGLRVMEALVEGATKLREMQLEAAARAHADIEATRKSMAAATDIARLLELQAEWARANAQRCAEYWRGLYDVAARTQADIAGSVVPRVPAAAEAPATPVDASKEAVVNLLKFFRHESCGQCTPCREGTDKMVGLLKAKGALNEPALRDLEAVMRDSSICGLGQAAPNPVAHLLTLFGKDSSR